MPELSSLLLTRTKVIMLSRFLQTNILSTNSYVKKIFTDWEQGPEGLEHEANRDNNGYTDDLQRCGIGVR